MRLGTAATKWATIASAVPLLLAACGEAAPEPRVEGALGTTTAAVPSSGPTASTEPTTPDLEGPPPVIVQFFDESVALEAWTYCYGNVCADGAPPADPPDVGNPGEVVLESPLAGWSFSAEFRPAGKKCGRIQVVPLEPVGDGRFLLRPAGYAGTYDVTLLGRGAGSLFTTFRWTTPADGPLPTPEARLAVLAHSARRPHSYGVELELTNLVRTPKRATARVTVQARDGDAIAFGAKRSDARCLPEGTVYWDGPDARGLEAAALGEGPIDYRVELELDGMRYVAVPTWPIDEIAGNEPSVALHFSPSCRASRRAPTRRSRRPQTVVRLWKAESQSAIVSPLLGAVRRGNRD
jgi:hypothetical protein